jgi:hypothetical protein
MIAAEFKEEQRSNMAELCTESTTKESIGRNRSFLLIIIRICFVRAISGVAASVLLVNNSCAR